MSDRYEPISCDFHDQLEAAAVKKHDVEIVFDEQGMRQRERGTVEDVFTREGAEFARLRNGDGSRDVRLDHIVELHEFDQR